MSRIELPPKWKWTTLGELATSVKNGIYVSRPSTEPNGIPILRIGAVRPMHLSLDDLRYTGMSLAEVQRNDGLVRPGDLLFTRYNGNPRLVGACARVPDHSPIVAYPDKLIRVVLPAEEVDSRFISYAWISSEVQAQVRSRIKTTAGQTGISGSSLRSIRLPLPPLAEQRRIAQVLGHATAVRAKRRMAMALLDDLSEAIFLDMFGDPFKNDCRWHVMQVAEVGAVQLGRQRAPKYQTGKFTRPYMRVANVYEDRIDLSDVLSMDFDEFDFKKYKLHDGDILLNEGQSTELVGRPAIWRNEIEDCCFQNTLVRFRCKKGVVDPLYTLAVFKRYFHTGEFAKISSKTSNMAHLGAARFAGMPFPLPPFGVQLEFSKRIQSLNKIKANHEIHLTQFDALFASLQDRAFCGVV